MKKRILSLLISMCMVIGLMPTVVFATQDPTLVYNETELRDAITNATSGDTITIGGDIELTQSSSIEIDKDITLDLSGKAVAFQSSDFYVRSNGTLTVKDSSAEKNGLITSSSYGIYSQGTVNVLGGTVQSTGTYSAAIRMQSSTAITNISGGTLKSTYSCIEVRAVPSPAQPVINITGGTFNNTGFNIIFSATGVSKYTVTDYYTNSTDNALMISPAKYTITFNLNYSGTTNTYKGVNTQNKLSSIPTPTREGYTFNGWYDGITEVTTDYVFTSDTTIFARWKQIVNDTINSDVNVTSGAPVISSADLSNALDDTLSGDTINVELTSTGKTDDDVVADANAIKQFVNDSNAIYYFFDLTVTKQVNSGATQTLNTLDNLVTISFAVPDGYKDSDLRILRMHNGVADELKKTPNADGEYFSLNSDSSIATLHIKNFCTFSISVSAAAPISVFNPLIPFLSGYLTDDAEDISAGAGAYSESILID